MLVVHHDGKSHDYNNFYDQYINIYHEYILNLDVQLWEFFKISL